MVRGPVTRRRGIARPPTLDVVDAPLEVARGVVIPAEELHWRFSRSSGPGGQGVNTADSRVRLTWDLAGSNALSDPLKTRALERLAGRLVDGAVVVTASEFRSQRRNRDAARARLAALLRDAVAAPPPSRRASRPSASARRRRLEDKRRRSDVKRLRRPESW